MAHLLTYSVATQAESEQPSPVEIREQVVQPVSFQARVLACQQLSPKTLVPRSTVKVQDGDSTWTPAVGIPWLVALVGEGGDVPRVHVEYSTSLWDDPRVTDGQEGLSGHVLSGMKFPIMSQSLIVKMIGENTHGL